ncbi:MAG TPA: glycosyltransferase family 4 protein [Patescibacteria group bacterium]|nr:glycosyltransferase family 4 protein [Patescibacteria group bacterium]
MKILRIVSAGYEQGGAENGIVQTNNLLRANGHEIRTISSDNCPDLEHYSDYEFAGVPNKGIKKVIYAAFNYSAYRLVQQILTEFKPDVVLLHTMSQPTAAVLFLLKQYPTILFVHGPELYTRSLLPWYISKQYYKRESYRLDDLTAVGWLHYLYFRYICGGLYKIALVNVDRVVALSSYTKSFLQVEGFTPTYIPNGVRMIGRKPIQAKPVLLYSGRLEKFKGVDDLLRAMPAIIEAVPATTLNIAGDGSSREELRQLTKDLRIEKHVHFLGHLNQEQLTKNYHTCSLLVMPSTWPETFGKVGVEAMSVGRPVIATRVGGVSDWLADGKNGYLVDPYQPEQISEKAITLLSDTSLLKQMSGQAYESAQAFSMRSFANNIEAAINSTIARSDA